MTNPLQTTTGIDVDAVQETTVAGSRAPASAAGPLPAVGTNAQSEWAMWDPNLWWTDWSLPPDPRPSWELWFDWVNQLKGLTPALTAASQDWQTMIGQFDESLATVRSMRAELTDWTGPSAKTMSDSLDRLEDSITTKSAGIRDNPAKLDDLARTINDTVGPMTALDGEYQQVLTNLTACRQVAERGKPLMLNLATKLLQTGTDLENSVRTDNLAPQPVPPQALSLSDGPQGPTQQLTQVAGASNLTDPGAVAAAAQVPVAVQPHAAGAANLTDPGQVVSGTQGAAAALPGVAVGPADPAGASTVTPAGSAAASPSLAGVSAGGAAPTLPTAPVSATSTLAGTPTLAATPGLAATPAFGAAPAFTGTPGIAATPALAGGAMPVTPFAATGVAAVPMSVRPSEDAHGKAPSAAVVPVVVSGVLVNGSTGVPAALRGRASEEDRPER
jgi:hypothetical protein